MSSFAIPTLRVKLYLFYARYSLTLLRVTLPSLIFYQFSFRIKKHPIDVRNLPRTKKPSSFSNDAHNGSFLRYNFHNYHRGFVKLGQLFLVKSCHANVRNSTIKYMRRYTVYIYSRKIFIVFYHILNYDISTVISHNATCKEQTSTVSRSSAICILFATR